MERCLFTRKIKSEAHVRREGARVIINGKVYNPGRGGDKPTQIFNHFRLA